MTEKKPMLEYQSRATPRARKSPLIYVVATVCSGFVLLFSLALVGAITDRVKITDAVVLLLVGAAIAMAVYTFLAYIKSHTDEGKP